MSALVLQELLLRTCISREAMDALDQEERDVQVRALPDGICACLDASTGPEPRYQGYQMSSSAKARVQLYLDTLVVWGRVR